MDADGSIRIREHPRHSREKIRLPSPMITAYHHADFAAPIGQHIMPMRKFVLVAQEVGWLEGVRIEVPEPIDEADLRRVHTEEYVAAIRTGEPRGLAESQKFPWTPALYSSVRLTNGAVLAAARRALEDGVAAAIASGFHHSHAAQGEGFCTFNGLVVAAEKLHAEGRVRRVAVIDCDLHYGNGTAQLAATRPWLFAWSVYGNDYRANKAYADVARREHTDGPNHQSYALRAGCDGATQTKILTTALADLLTATRDAKPDLILYQAGADPLRDDPYSPLALTHEDLLERDRQVFRWAKANGLPIAWTLAGGYTPEIEKVVRVHVNTFHAALEVFGA